MNHDITVIGSGPGGYVAAIRAAQLGASVALIEKENLGGTCLNKGCIPTKAMLASVNCFEMIKHATNFGIKVNEPVFNINEVYDRQRKVVAQVLKSLEQLLSSYSDITIYKGTASIISPENIMVKGQNNNEIQTKNLIIATGSSCADLSDLPIDHKLIINSDDALNLTELPKKMLIIGAGAIGIEWCRIFSAFGVEVTLVEMLNRIAPSCDEDVSNVALKLFKKAKVKLKIGIRVDDVQKNPEGIMVTLSDGEVILTDKVLLAVGRKPNTNIEGLDKLNLEFNGRFIKTNSYMQTNLPNVYAIGDVVGKLQLAHVASHEAIVAVETILNHNPDPVDYACVPFCIYGNPEIAAVGLTEEQAKTLNLAYESNKYFYAANGKAVAESESIGLIKTIVDSNTQKILGVHIIGAHASDIIHQGVIAIKNGLTVKQFRDTIFAHPTFSEVFSESIINLHVPGKLKLALNKG